MKRMSTMKKIFLMCLASLLFTACGSDLSNWFEDNTVTLTITADKGTVTRATFDTDGDDITATWDATDKLIVVVNGYQSELSLESGAGTTTATFSGELECGGVKPSATTRLDVYVKNDNITIRDDGSYVYTGTALTSQPGTLDGATALGVYMATPAYGDGTISGVTFAPVTSLVKFAVTVPEDMEADTEAMLSYSFKTGHVKTTISAPFTTVAHPATSDVWIAVPAGTYTANRLRLVTNKADVINGLSNNASMVTLLAGKKYSMTHEFDPNAPLESDAEPLTFQALEDGQIVISNPLGLEITYCVNNGTTTTRKTTTINIDVPANGIVYLFGDNAAYATSADANKYTNINCNVDCYVYGNIMSLINSIDYPTLTSLSRSYAFCNLFKDNIHLLSHPTKELTLPATTFYDYTYQNMFRGCLSLKKAPALPATTLKSYCYTGMFYGCTSLTEAPELPAESMEERCYQEMFYGCTSLAYPPDLPATTLKSYCYSGMFNGCSSLMYAPELPATSVSSYCYQNMFKDCVSLTEAPKLPAMTAASYCYQYMFSGCTSLTKAPALPATTINDYCYGFMFQNCTSLTSIPTTLPATTLATSCYSGMFQGCTSLAKAPTLPATTLLNSCYSSMFKGCSNLKTAPALPAMTAVNSCYNGMFSGCTSLTAAPALPATTLANYCYYEMFRGCTSLTSAPSTLPVETMFYRSCYSMFDGCSALTSAPSLPAMTMAQECYSYMFRNCTSLTAAPDLPATTLVSSCYTSMFYGCSSLSYIKCMATSIGSHTNNFLRNVATNGTFVKNPNMNGWSTGPSGIPEGWTVTNAN